MLTAGFSRNVVGGEKLLNETFFFTSEKQLEGIDIDGIEQKRE